MAMLFDMRCLLPSLILTLASPVLAADPDDYDPILDGGPPGSLEQRLPKRDDRDPGFQLSGHVGIYLGKTSSTLTSRRSELRPELSGLFGVGIGYRTPSPIELGVDIALGFGETWDQDLNEWTFAFDLLVEPRLLVHVYETGSFGVYFGAATDIIMFDVEPAGMNQFGLGPTLVSGLAFRSPGSLLFIELSGTAFYDFFAFKYIQPTEEELEEDPFATEEKEYGEWFGIFRITLGYRVNGF